MKCLTLNLCSASEMTVFSWHPVIAWATRASFRLFPIFLQGFFTHRHPYMYMYTYISEEKDSVRKFQIVVEKKCMTDFEGKQE